MARIANEREARQQELARQMQMFRELIDRNVIRFSHARNLQGVIADESYEPLFRERHNGLHQARLFADALLQYEEAVSAEGQESALEPAYKRARDLGGFLEWYTPEMVLEWMQSPRRLFVYAMGSPIDPQTLAERAAIIGGDIHLEIPEDDPDAELACSLPHLDNGDDLFDVQNQQVRSILEEIKANHAIAGCVRDIAADDTVAHLGFASQARSTAFEHVKALPRKNPIRYMIAELFSVTGLRTQDGKEIRIQSPHSPIANIMSMIVHARSKKYPALMGWRLRNKEAPVCLNGDDPGKQPSKLLVDWHALIHKL